MGQDVPDAPKVKSPPKPVDTDAEAKQAELARQRNSLEAMRKGRRSLRIDVGNPGMNAGATGGLRIPD